jgi:hypothetical protein
MNLRAHLIRYPSGKKQGVEAETLTYGVCLASARHTFVKADRIETINRQIRYLAGTTKGLRVKSVLRQGVVLIMPEPKGAATQEWLTSCGV